MAEALAMLHWIAGIDANDVEFVLAPCNGNDGATINNVLGRHSMWMLDFDLCRNMTMDENGVGKAVKAFWRNDPSYPRPEKALWHNSESNTLVPVMSAWGFVTFKKGQSNDFCRDYLLNKWKPGTPKSSLKVQKSVPGV
ncbi:hypothetical protein PENFLA_c031G00161 [Penicillium flavigenum]|uniref:DUF3669 domain-containing protein n=1 Tax=Penicillium flavigenum TaxID=254877 RepID=A0A1V6SPB2_9EURO|nr:hypothetical protein PENFLA_c031G00161 [Penicillium flavigenum]